MNGSVNIRSYPRVFWISIAICICLIMVNLFQWSLIDLLTPFLIIPLLGVIWIIYLSTWIWSIAYLLHHRKKWRKSCAAFAVCFGTFLIVLLVPFTQIWLKYDFWVNRSAREQVVLEIDRGKLIPNVAHNSSLIALGKNYPNLSMGGNEIVVEEHDRKKYIFFFTFRGILDSYSGFIWIPRGGDSNKYSDAHKSDLTEIVPFAENWFYASHH